VAYNSKKYYLLGNVVQKGVFPLDRPLTIVEAIAKAQGFQTAVVQSNTLMMADLSRSFLIRKQPDGIFAKIPVDFEALFLRGDLKENQVMAPDDYLYFPPLNLQEVYVLGEVVRPGVAPYLESQTALRSIVARGGFTDRAFRSRILVVRGSLNHPQTFMVDASDLLAGKSLDFPLQARDIVYVHRKPWYKVEELLQLAVTDFLRAAVITAGGTRIGPFITRPVF
jgi:protein involved in polysaccharide export with SLBB domain